MAIKITKCELCGMVTTTRGHHFTPKSKGGDVRTPVCETCESYVHKTWTNNELRDIYNTPEAILATEGFQKFLKWRWKQPPTALFKSVDGKFRDKRKYS